MRSVYLISMVDATWPNFYVVDELIWNFVQKGKLQDQVLALVDPDGELGIGDEMEVMKDDPEDRMNTIANNLPSLQGVMKLMVFLKEHDMEIVAEDAFTRL